MDKRIIFLHIPKAGGMTLHSILSREYSGRRIYSMGPSNISAELEQFKSLPQPAREDVGLLMGHMPYGLHAYLPEPSTYITMIRHPVRRIISHYHYVLSQPTHYLYPLVTSEALSLKEFVTNGLSVELDNGQTRLLSGDFGETPIGQCSEAMLAEAMNHIKSMFSVVGIMELFDASILHMKYVLRWKRRPLYTRRNVSSGRDRDTPIPPETISLIEGYNRLDMELYDKCKSALLNGIASGDYDVHGNLKRFQRMNQYYQHIMKLLGPTAKFYRGILRTIQVGGRQGTLPS